MIKNSQSIMLDKVDKSVLRALQADGRLSNVELARKISLSPPAAHARVRRLEKDGYIRQYTAIVDREKAGYDLLVFYPHQPANASGDPGGKIPRGNPQNARGVGMSSHHR